MNSIKRTWIILGIFFVFIFSGCSIPTDFYIQNLTGTPKVLKINYKKGAFDRFSEDSYGTFSFNYENDIVNPKFFKKNRKNLKSLEKKADSSGTTITIEAYSTVRIEKTHNFYWSWNIENIEIDGKRYNSKDLEEKSEKIKDDYIFKIEK
ncbi:hypothetical protein [Chryseobacterium arthrosphaerae]|uniref:hypothetical protein n=1 Tax=Chryseobacterium arthrosphaerae TaxID=651561 RepID=UPI001F4A9F2B|nr:hypothetical protein [Chryseobacterium arthrosphaerae]